MALRRQQFAQFGPVAVGVGEVERGIDVLEAQRLQLRRQRLAMVDDVAGAEFTAPLCRLLARRGRDHGEAGQARQLDRDRTHAAGAADDQQDPAGAAAFEGIAHALEQQFPGGERGERQGRGLREIERAGLARDDALVDQLQLRVAAGAGDVAGVVDRVAGTEHRDLRADRLDHPGRVVAQHLRLRFDLRLRRAHLGIDRIHRDRFDAHQQVATLRDGRIEFDIEQRLRVVDGQVAGEGDGFHGVGSRWGGTGGGLRSANMPFQ